MGRLNMHVCILAPFRVIPPIDGAARRVFEISLGLCNAGASVTLLHCGESSVPRDNFRVIGFPSLERLAITKGFTWSRALDVYFSSLNFGLCQQLMLILRKTKVDVF